MNQTDDSDGDGIPNILEIITGTNPDDSTDFISMAIPSTSYINNTGDVTINYDFSTYFYDYSFATSLEATFPAGSLKRGNVPLLITVRNMPPDSIPPFSDSTYDVLGRYISFLEGNSINLGWMITLQTPQPQVVSSNDYVPFQYDDSSGKWIKIADSAITGSNDISQTVKINSTKPIIYAAKKKTLSTTFYFDGGYVYSNKINSVLKLDIHIPKDTSIINNVTAMVKYLDYSINSLGIKKVFQKECVLDSLGTCFENFGQLICPGKMRIQEAGIILKNGSIIVDSCKYVCSSDLTIYSGQSLVMQCYNSISEYLNYSDSEYQISLYSYPCSETFESANFGDGRILINTAAGDSAPLTYEYFLVDHLGSTRMVINDQNIVTEAFMYHPYGNMIPIGTFTSAIPVRETFIGKEFDQDGATNGVGGIKLIYFGGRYYDPEVGIFISTDPAGQFFHAYNYCAGNPINFIDPTGAIVEGLDFESDQFTKFILNASEFEIDMLIGYISSSEEFRANDIFPGRSSGGPFASVTFGLPFFKNAGLGLSIQASDAGYYFSFSTGQITGGSFVSGWNFANPSRGISTEATIAGGKLIGGSYAVAIDNKNDVSFSSSIGAGIGLGLSKGLTATTTIPIYEYPYKAANIRNIMHNSVTAPDRTRTR